MLFLCYDNYVQFFVVIEMKIFGKKFVLVGILSVYGKQWVDLIESEWKKQGGIVGCDNVVDYNIIVDFSVVVIKVFFEKFDVLFIGGFSQFIVFVIKVVCE